jgi:hypothetical protein
VVLAGVDQISPGGGHFSLFVLVAVTVSAAASPSNIILGDAVVFGKSLTAQHEMVSRAQVVALESI